MLPPDLQIEEERAHNAAKEQERQAEIAKAKTELHAALENVRALARTHALLRSAALCMWPDCTE